MSDRADNARLSPDGRLGEIATILATGIVRLRQRAALPTGKRPENPGEPGPEGLAILPETRLSVRVVNGIRDPYKEPKREPER